ncbi:MAG: hypothetical protein ACE5PV_00860 [Candidatus Poribacteria bacterium]
MGRQLQVMGDAKRFSVVAEYVEIHFPEVKYIADVAGGKGYLSRLLSKKNYDCELIEPREKVVKGVKHRKEQFRADMADYYDLLIGLHPDDATRELAKAALIRPVILIPCCNFWDDKRRGLKDLLEAIKDFYRQNSIYYQEHKFDFKGPMNIGLVSLPDKR